MASDALAVEIPADVREKMKGEVVEYQDWLTSEGVYDYSRQVLGALSDIPKSARIAPEDCLFYFMYYHLRLIADLLSATPMTYRPRHIEKVSFGGKIYKMPESLRIGDDIVPMAGETADNFVEASNILRQYGLLADKGVKHLNYFVAVYLREEEGYDEQKIAERAEVFKDMTMDIYWEVFFCIHRLSAKRAVDTLRYLTGRRRSLRWALRFGFLRWPNPAYWALWIKSRKSRSGKCLKS